jgi:hypothetical protein
MGADSVASFESLVALFFGVFTVPTVPVFLTLVRGWVLCLGRPTIRRLVSVVDGAGPLLWACARFFRKSRWGMQELWRVVVIEVLVPWVAAVGRLIVAADDTTCDKFGQRVAFAAIFRDAVHSAGGRTVFHRAHCWVVLSLQVRLPLWKRVLSFPISARLYRKEGDCDAKHPFRTRQQLVLEMVREVRAWLPDRVIEVVGDGAYPCEELVTGLPPRVFFTSRMRSDAALYERARRPRKPRPGRPRQKGKRLPTPERMARRVRNWKRVRVVLYGEEKERLVWTRKVLWWSVAKTVPVLLVISRDPERQEDDDFLVTTDVEADPAHVVETFAMRWGIEEIFREGKQLFGFRKVQGWSPRSVERQAPFALFVQTLVKAWYVHHIALRQKPDELPPTAAMLTELRFPYWQARINRLSLPNRERRQILEAVRNALSAAA